MNTIATDRLRLEPLAVAHAEAMFEVLGDPSLHVYIDMPPPASLAALRQRYARLEARTSPDGSQGWLNWIVVLPQAGPIGFVQATVIGRMAWVAYLVSRAHGSRGLASEATAAMLSEVASTHGVARFQATVEVENEPSVRLLTRLGFHEATDGERGTTSLTPTERLYVRGASDRPAGSR